MKTFLTTVLILTSTNAVVAQSGTRMKAVEEKTLFTCQQTDGDKWYEVGVVQDKQGSQKLLLVKHDSDSDSNHLVRELYARATGNETSIKFTCIEDGVNFSLSVTTTGNSSRGSFIYQEDVMPTPLKDERMDCYPNSTISYEVEADLEKN
jgi:hypothetical protein